MALGEATKTVPYVTDATKDYQFTVKFGEATNTDDADGEIIERSDHRPDDAMLSAALKQFEGDIQQVPPAFSAVKVDGVRAYKRAREGQKLELEARPLFVEELSLTERPDPDHATLRLVCGKGGYVRSIARDLGRALGTCAHVARLRRSRTGPFDEADSVSLDEIEELARTPEILEFLQPLEVALSDLPEVRLAQDGALRIQNGNPGRVLYSDADFGDEAWGSLNGRAMAIGTYRSGELHPTRVFRYPENPDD